MLALGKRRVFILSFNDSWSFSTLYWFFSRTLRIDHMGWKLPVQIEMLDRKSQWTTSWNEKTNKKYFLILNKRGIWPSSYRAWCLIVPNLGWKSHTLIRCRRQNLMHDERKKLQSESNLGLDASEGAVVVVSRSLYWWVWPRNIREPPTYLLWR